MVLVINGLDDFQNVLGGDRGVGVHEVVENILLHGPVGLALFHYFVDLSAVEWGRRRLLHHTFEYYTLWVSQDIILG